ncbi:MAG TPA: hypothetical protein VMU50_11360, partial [Polyangia bacterium]|nr:hypothetical protein [Polyangia bacterium]
MPYAVDWIEAAHARDEHLGVWERNLLLPVTARRRFDWLYRDNPAGPGRLAVLRATSADRTAFVGTAGYAVRALDVGGEARRAALLADLAVDRAHRTAMPALMLLRAVRADVLARQDAVYGFPNPQADPLLRRLGYRLLGQTRRFVLVFGHRRHIGETLREKLGAAWGARATPVASIALDVVRAALVAGLAAQAAVTHRLQFVTEVEVDERFDRLWQTARSDYPVVGVRDAAFVRWRFLGCPEGPMELAVMQARKSDQLEGYAVISRAQGVAHVRDLFAPR